VKRALVLISGGAGRGKSADRRTAVGAEIEAQLAKRGLAADTPQTASADEAAALLRDAAAAGYELAVVAGGDGSVRLAVDALAGTELPLGIVPLGTGNLLAATLGIARDPMVAAVRLVSAKPQRIDTGLLTAEGRREGFAVSAGLGFDARLMAATDPRAKARFGVLAYFIQAARLIAALPVAQTEIVVDGRSHQLSTVAVMVANCGQLVPGLLGPRAPLDPFDGKLDVIAIKSHPVPALAHIRATASALDSLLRGGPGMGGESLRLQGSEVEVRSEPAEPIQVDGDLLPLEGGEFRAKVRPRSLTVLV